MANSKISELSAASAITGAEQVPVVQGGSTVRSTAGAIGWTKTVVAEGPDGATRASTTLGPFSTPWTGTIAVAAGQVVDIIVTMSVTASGDESMWLAIRRGSTTIYENPHYTANPNARAVVHTHFWRDATPGTGNVVYEIYTASGGATVTLRNGATLDTTAQLTQGKSAMRLEARST